MRSAAAQARQYDEAFERFLRAAKATRTRLSDDELSTIAQHEVRSSSATVEETLEYLLRRLLE